MPMVLQPLPRRIRRTHEHFALGRPTALVVPPSANEAIATALREILEPLIPEIDPADSVDKPAAVLQFALFEGSGGVPEGVPPDVADQAYQIDVSPDRIIVTAGSETGWLPATR